MPKPLLCAQSIVKNFNMFCNCLLSLFSRRKLGAVNQ